MEFKASLIITGVKKPSVEVKNVSAFVATESVLHSLQFRNAELKRDTFYIKVERVG